MSIKFRIYVGIGLLGIFALSLTFTKNIIDNDDDINFNPQKKLKSFYVDQAYSRKLNSFLKSESLQDLEKLINIMYENLLYMKMNNIMNQQAIEKYLETYSLMFKDNMNSKKYLFIENADLLGLLISIIKEKNYSKLIESPPLENAVFCFIENCLKYYSLTFTNTSNSSKYNYNKSLNLKENCILTYFTCMNLVNDNLTSSFKNNKNKDIKIDTKLNIMIKDFNFLELFKKILLKDGEVIKILVQENYLEECLLKIIKTSINLINIGNEIEKNYELKIWKDAIDLYSLILFTNNDFSKENKILLKDVLLKMIECNIISNAIVNFGEIHELLNEKIEFIENSLALMKQ